MKKTDVRDVLETILPIQRDEDGDYFSIMPKDNDFNHNVLVFFILDENVNKFQMYSMTDFSTTKVEAAVRFCNKWNSERSFGQAFFREDSKSFHITCSLNNPENVSISYLKDDFVRFNLSVIWQFYKEVEAEFK